MLSHMKRIRGHPSRFPVSIERLQSLIINDWLRDILVISFIVAHVRWEPVHILKDVRKDFDFITKRLVERFPHELHRLVL